MLEDLREPADPEERAVVERYLKTFEEADVPGLTRLLADDVMLEMPPVDLWLAGPRTTPPSWSAVFAMRGPRVADGRPCRPTGDRRWRRTPRTRRAGLRAHSLQVFDVRDGLVRRTT